MKIKNCFLLFFVITCLFYLGCIGTVNNIRSANDFDLQPKEKFNFMTFNIRVGCGWDSYGTSPYRCTPTKKNLNLVIEAIKSEDPDVVALQEVKGFRQAEYIAKKLNMNFAYITHGGNHPWWGMAILSKFEILNSKTSYIHYGRDVRSALISEIKIDDNPYHFVNVHYHLGNYKSQVSSTMSIVNKIDGPVILLGDFNRSDWDYEMEPVHDSLIDTCKAVSTENSKNVVTVGTGFGRIDYIFVQDKYFTVLDAGIVSVKKYRYASDHIAYYSIVKIKNQFN